MTNITLNTNEKVFLIACITTAMDSTAGDFFFINEVESQFSNYQRAGFAGALQRKGYFHLVPQGTKKAQGVVGQSSWGESLSTVLGTVIHSGGCFPSNWEALILAHQEAAPSTPSPFAGVVKELHDTPPVVETDPRVEAVRAHAEKNGWEGFDITTDEQILEIIGTVKTNKSAIAKVRKARK